MQSQHDNYQQRFPWFKYPLLVCAPMVDQSELPFRMLTRRHGVNLAYTPMLHSRMMTTNKGYKQQHFTTCPQDRPLVAQLCGNDPQTMVKAAKMVENQVDAIDINLGCPQGIARKGHYGSYLLEEPQLIQKMVIALSANIKVPIFCKIRILRSEQKTLELAKRIEKAGCKLLTIHGRLKQQNKDLVGTCNWEIIRKIKETLTIPVVANGGVYLFPDVDNCLAATNADGVMSAQGLLQNPALFNNYIEDLDDLALEYLDLTQKYPGASDSCMRAHLFKMLYAGLSKNIDLRERLAKGFGLETFREIVLQLKQRREGVPMEEKLGWYLRYWKKLTPKDYLKGISAPEVQEKLLALEMKMANEEGKKQEVQEVVPAVGNEVEKKD